MKIKIKTLDIIIKRLKLSIRNSKFYSDVYEISDRAYLITRAKEELHLGGSVDKAIALLLLAENEERWTSSKSRKNKSPRSRNPGSDNQGVAVS